MKKRFMAILLAGGLTLGLCGCGGGSSTSAMPTPPEETVEPSVEDEAAVAESEVETEEADAKSYSIDEEQPDQISNDAESIAQPEESLENENAESNADMLSLLSTHIIEYEDQDGYQIRETCQLSPIFREDDSEDMYALWEALGNDAADFPSEESLYDASHSMEYARDVDSCSNMEYIIGTYKIENLTDGFSITPGNLRTYVRALHAEQVTAGDSEHDANAANSFNLRSVSAVINTDGIVCYGEQDAVVIGNLKMTSDTWGPVCFVIALPNGATPNRPNGYRYDKISVEFGNKAYADSGYDVFELNYFGEGGD